MLLALMAVSHAFAQPDATAIEKSVDDTEYQRILEYYNYDPGMPSDPVFYGEWPWRGPHTLYKLSYSSVRGQRVPAYLAIPKETASEKIPVVVLMHGWNLFWGKNEDWVLDWIPLLTAQGYAVLAPDHFMYGERKRDIDPDRIAIFGGSLGGWIGSILAALEPRIKTAVLSVPATESATAQTPPGRIINASNFFPRYKDLSLLMELAKNDVPLRNARAKEFFDLVKVKKEMVEYDESHFLDPQKYNQEILEWLKENL
ncbi:MAG: hypothetical protein AMS26_05115 [Bacteroides sp. SM23_62]|nr:MAG: hypothetical protein AMS26_05115 [Bacteroides sp. SM23_62]